MYKHLLCSAVALGLFGCETTPSLPVKMTRKENGAWVSQFKSGMGEAVTGNESGSSFGVMCTAIDCNYYVSTNLNCTPGTSYPGLISLDDAAHKMTIGCKAWTRSGGTTTNVFWIDFDAGLHQQFTKSKRFTLAAPMQSGQFKLMRFELEGYEPAVLRVLTALKPQSIKPAGPRDAVK